LGANKLNPKEVCSGTEAAIREKNGLFWIRLVGIRLVYYIGEREENCGALRGGKMEEREKRIKAMSERNTTGLLTVKWDRT